MAAGSRRGGGARVVRRRDLKRLSEGNPDGAVLFSPFASSISQPEWMVARRPGWAESVDGWMEGLGKGRGGVKSSALHLLPSLRCHLLPRGGPEVVGVLLTRNPSQRLAAGSRVTCHSA